MKSKILRDLFDKYSSAIIMMMMIGIITVAISLFGVEIGRRIINVISSPSLDWGAKQRLLLIYCSGLLAMAVAGGAAGYGLDVKYTKFSQAYISDIRIKLFKHLLQMPQHFFNKNPIGQITNRIMNEVGSIGDFVTKTFLGPVIHIVMVFFYCVYLFKLNWKLAIVSIVFIPISVIILPKYNRRMQKLTAESIDSTGSLTGYVQEVFTGITDIRANQAYYFEESRLKKKIRELTDIKLKMVKTAGMLECLITGITQLAPLTIYFYGGTLCMKGEFPVGTLVASIVIINSLYDPVNFIVRFILEWHQVRVRFNKIDEYMRFEPETGIFPAAERDANSVGDVQLDKVQFGFAEGQILLNDISFAAQSGDKVAFVGPSGSGKSLTAALIGTIYKPLLGFIAFAGKKADSIPLHALRSRIGYVSQTLFLFNDTIRNNILYGLLRKPHGDNDRIETWVDFSLLDEIESMEMLDQRILDIVRNVGLFEDIMNIGLWSRLESKDGEITESDKTKIVRARKELKKEIERYDQESVELYKEEKYLEYCTIFENIVFSPAGAISQKYGSMRQFCKEHLYDHLRGKGLVESLFYVGLKLARADNMLLEKLYKDESPLLDSIEFDPQKLESRKKINEKLATSVDSYARIEKTDPALVEDIIDLALNHCPGRSKEQVLDDKTRNEILDLRRDVREILKEDSREDIASYDDKAFNNFLSLMENIVFGNIDPLRKRANEEISASVRRLVKEAGLEGLAFKRGLEFNVGERGAKLSGGQRQKVVIARILLRNPSILIMDEATSALDSASQARIHDLVAEKYKDITVIAIAHRLNTVKDYDEILVFDKGRIVERGTFDDLMKTNGLFMKLYQGSN
jgi:ABC-type multidrug transport system fused ATPase/permease subunit